MFRVEIRLSDEDRLIETVEAMRTWLKAQEFVPSTFGYSLASSRVLFRVDFASAAQATARSKAFSPPTHNRPTLLSTELAFG